MFFILALPALILCQGGFVLQNSGRITVTETQTLYNDISDNTNLTRRKLRHLICQLYMLEGRWESLPIETKHELWHALTVRTMQDMLDDMAL